LNRTAGPTAPITAPLLQKNASDRIRNLLLSHIVRAAGIPLRAIVNAKTLGTTIRNGNALIPNGLVEPSPDRNPARISSDA
jgi:hypothetical protein